jgi:hypothetical protein
MPLDCCSTAQREGGARARHTTPRPNTGPGNACQNGPEVNDNPTVPTSHESRVTGRPSGYGHPDCKGSLLQ